MAGLRVVVIEAGVRDHVRAGVENGQCGATSVPAENDYFRHVRIYQVKRVIAGQGFGVVVQSDQRSTAQSGSA
jgi:hypothetical protein